MARPIRAAQCLVCDFFAIACPVALLSDSYKLQSSLAGANYMEMTHSLSSCSSSSALAGQQSSSAASSLRVHVVQHSANYCARVADLASYGEVNREVSQGR